MAKDTKSDTPDIIRLDEIRRRRKEEGEASRPLEELLAEATRRPKAAMSESFVRVDPPPGMPELRSRPRRRVRLRDGKLIVSNDPDRLVAMLIVSALSDPALKTRVFGPEGAGYASNGVFRARRCKESDDPEGCRYTAGAGHVWVVERDVPGGGDAAAIVDGGEIQWLMRNAYRLLGGRLPKE